MVSPVTCLALPGALWFQMILITYSSGLVLQGLVLSFGEQAMRVAIKDSDDAVEFRMIRGVWVSEDCEVVRLEWAGQVAPPDEIPGDDFLEAMLCAVVAALPVQRIM
jgi:hypothetical protein